MEARTLIFTWAAGKMAYNEKDFEKSLREYISKKGPHFLTYTMEKDEPAFEVHEGDRFYVLRIEDETEEEGRQKTAGGIVLAGEIASELVKVDEGTEKERSIFRMMPMTAIDARRAKYISIENLCEEMPNVDWTDLPNGTLLNNDDADQLNDMWIDFMTDNFEQFECNGSKARKPAAVFLGDDASVLSDDDTLYDRLFRRYNHVCDLCGFDMDFSYAKLPTVPRMCYFVRKYVPMSATGREIRSVKCLCRNCLPLVERYSWEELTEKVRMMNVDSGAIQLSMKVRNAPKAMS